MTGHFSFQTLDGEETPKVLQTQMGNCGGKPLASIYTTIQGNVRKKKRIL